MAEKGHALHMETWVTFHVGCIEGMAEKGHTIHENLACFTCWVCSRASNTLYIETWLALHVGCVVQLYTLHVNLARFTCCNWVCDSDNCFGCLRVYGILIQLFLKLTLLIKKIVVHAVHQGSQKSS